MKYFSIVVVSLFICNNSNAQTVTPGDSIAAYEGDNPDLLNYVGRLEAAYQWTTLNKRLTFDLAARKGNKLDWRGSLQAQLSYKLNKNENQYITLQWFTGYGESLIDYKQKRQIIRMGIMIKPSRFIFY